MKTLFAGAVLALSIATAAAQDEDLDWVGVQISTGKFSEDIGAAVFKTEAECLAYKTGEDQTCFPIPALPASYWQRIEDSWRDMCRRRPDGDDTCVQRGFATEGQYLATLTGAEREQFAAEVAKRRFDRDVENQQFNEYENCKNSNAVLQTGWGAWWFGEPLQDCFPLAPWRR